MKAVIDLDRLFEITGAHRIGLTDHVPIEIVVRYLGFDVGCDSLTEAHQFIQEALKARALSQSGQRPR